MSTKARFFDYAVTKSGNTVQIVPYAEIYLYVKNSDPESPDPLLDTIYDKDDVVISQPIIADEYGAFEFFLDDPKRVMISYDDPLGGIIFLDNEPVEPDPELIIYTGSNTLVELEGGLTVSSDDGELIDAQGDYISLAEDVLFIDRFARLVGVNTDQPEAQLDVHGSFRVEDTLGNRFLIDESILKYMNSDGTSIVELTPDGFTSSLIPAVDSASFIGSSTRRWITVYALVAAVARGAIAGPSITCSLETTTGFSFPSTGQLAASILTNEIWLMDADEFRTQVAISMKEQASLPSPGTGLAIMAPRNDGRWYNQHNGGSAKYFVESDQIETLAASGVTSGPTTSAPTSYTDLTDMTLTFNNCVAGDKLNVDFFGAFLSNTNNAAIVVALKHNSNAEVYTISLVLPTAGVTIEFITGGVFTATAGTNTVKVRWFTNLGTATANGVDRHMKGIRSPK